MYATTDNEGIKRAIDYIAKNQDSIKKAEQMQARLWRRERQEIPPLALTCSLTEEQQGWLSWSSTKAIHYDPAKMLANGLLEAMTAVNGAHGAVPSVRANMGCGIIASLFGLTQELFDDKMPWMLQHKSKDDIRNMTASDLCEGVEFSAAIGHMEYLKEKLSCTGVRVYPLDIQGAFDTAHLAYGDAIFYDIYDDPAFMHHLLSLSADAAIHGMDRCLDIIGCDDGTAHYNFIYMPPDIGGVKLSEDTSTLVSADTIDEFVTPYASRIYQHFNGGYMHYCGRNSHLFETFFTMPLAYGLNLGNPDKHDMDHVLRRVAESGKIYAGGIARMPDEPLYEYFIRILKPAYKDGIFHILPQFSCPLGERDSTVDAFMRAAELIQKLYF